MLEDTTLSLRRGIIDSGLKMQRRQTCILNLNFGLAGWSPLSQAVLSDYKINAT